MHAISMLSQAIQAITPHPFVAPWIAIVVAIGFGGLALLIVEIKKSA